MRPRPKSRGLYNECYEHDACGVGLVCNVNGSADHLTLNRGLEVLSSLAHRGACGSDPDTGDGAGITIQIPDRFLRAECDHLGFELPAPGDYGVGMIFLPPDESAARRYRDDIETTIDAEGQRCLGWRRVPVDSEQIGVAARHTEPGIWQCFIGRNAGTEEGFPFERKLYVIRKIVEKSLAAKNPDRSTRPYIVSLSSRTLIYKGMLTAEQLSAYFPDLSNEAVETALAIVHSRFSTNTLPRWSLAHPFRLLSHNGEINTLRGNVNWMRAREALFSSAEFGDDLVRILPALEEDASDSAALDNALELLYHTGRSLPHAMMMLIPEAWERDRTMPQWKSDFYAYHACMMEPWDGPAAVLFTDGRYAGAVLDRNGLRPARYTLTHDGVLILSSETGVLDVDPENEKEKGRIYPGHMFLVDLEEGRVVNDDEIKETLSKRRPYGKWLKEEMLTEADIPPAGTPPVISGDDLATHYRLFGYTDEDIRMLMLPMIDRGKEAMGSMGADIPHAVLSSQPRPLFDYFKQLFAQVTNPPLDAIRERVVTSLYTYLGGSGNLFEETPKQAHVLRLKQPILENGILAGLATLKESTRIDTVFDAGGERGSIAAALEEVCLAASSAVAAGSRYLILSDRSADARRAPLPSLLVTAAVHHHLIRTGDRLRCSILVESGEPREVHHFCVLIGYGADAINPYLALDTALSREYEKEADAAPDSTAIHRYVDAVDAGILKVMSKMGISTLQGYRGAQIFEAIGIHPDVVDRYFTGTASRIGGISLEVITREVLRFHRRAFPTRSDDLDGTLSEPALQTGGRYRWRRTGEHHAFNPQTVYRLQSAVRNNRPDDYAAYAELINDQAGQPSTLRGLLEFDLEKRTPLPLDEVEEWTNIVRRFKTGAMSYGSISREAHETLARAMNRIGGQSNSGEGGEDPERYDRISSRRSRIKQVASGRFGVTISYLSSADEIQIKMAQGAKPGEGGQLPGEKVYPWIARTRYSTPYVGLISPPPHHDIYSIEDLAQLIYDLKHANPTARISVKLVSEVGVGTIAAGVAKAGADVVLISGFDGGTGAAPKTSIVHAGLPWELGLSETQQTLVRNGLRNRIRLECDGQLKTGRDVALAALLGAQEFGFATAPLVSLGCIMMRKCHLNTCPVGIATQDPVLRRHFSGEPDHIVNYFHFVAEELRGIMSRLGFRRLEEMVGRVDLLRQRSDVSHWKARYVNLDAVLYKPSAPDLHTAFDIPRSVRKSGSDLARELMRKAGPALVRAEPVEVDVRVGNGDRAVGTSISHAISSKFGPGGLPDDTVTIRAKGTGGQSFGAFGAPGLTIHLEGDANDYFGKGLSGARLILKPAENAGFRPHDNIVVGNVALYGAVTGKVFIRGRAGERFCVRNSGAVAVVEGVGDHGCEYMTGGCVVILGVTGRNFAAGMSGGVAYVMDGTQDFRSGRCNMESVEIERITSPEDATRLYSLIEEHYRLTGSSVADWTLSNWDSAQGEFVRVMPTEYRKALARLSLESNRNSAPGEDEPILHGAHLIMSPAHNLTWKK
jgi:glutamate synthase domain-containing protein 2/glutamate synthase domain-containing protein 1/glutamate synthase domain-containing protein 3